MPRTVIYLEDLGLGEKGIAEMLAPVSIRRLTLCLTWGSPALWCLQSLDERPRDPSLGGRFWPQFSGALGTVCLPVFSPTNGAGSWR
jgi:hypothetical protein